MLRNKVNEQQATSKDDLKRAADIYLQCRNITETGRQIGMSRDTAARRLARAAECGFISMADLPQHSRQRAKTASSGFSTLFELDKLPSSSRSLDEIFAAREGEYNRRDKAEKARDLIPVRVKITGPIGICHFGDPHLDNPGCDIKDIRRHVDIISRTEGMIGANVGDTTDNWVGRLAAIYSSHAVTAKEAWTLAEWLANALPWLYVIGGNHDVWSGDRDLLSWMHGQAGALYEHHGARLALNFPNGKEVRINARHTFPGHSQWNAAHGVSKAVQMGWRDHIAICGHKHISGYQKLKDPATGLISHAIQVAAFKKHDDYGKQLGLPDANISPSVTTIIDPSKADNDPALITVFDCPENAAGYLTWLRSR